jgi:hypothetical protein
MPIPENKSSILNMFPETVFEDISILDLWSSYKVSQEFQTNGSYFDKFQLEERHRWDTLAEEIYGDRQFWWVLVLFNNLDNPFAIDYDVNLDNSVNIIKVLKPEYLPNLIGEIRKFRLESET